MEESLFWADQEARRTILHSGEKKRYTCASGITPSGTVHIGNFREIITVDLVVKALNNLGKKTRFIYSWDNFDRLRKIPGNLPEEAGKKLEKHMYEPVSEIPDPLGCHSSYAKHWQTPLEEDVKELGIKPEFMYQNKKFRECKYAKGIRTGLKAREEVRRIINKYRKEARSQNWYPLEVYCEKCNKGTTKVTGYDEEYSITYECKCGNKNTVDFRKKGIVKPLWRLDWPMRWAHYGVDFEPAGKEHFAAGGSRTTGVEIVNNVYEHKEPYGFMYEFISLKGVKGKMSGSKGNVYSVRDVTQVYLPEIVRFLFAGTKPRKDFSISMDEDVLKYYDDFYTAERIAFKKTQASKRDAEHWKKVYDYSYGQGMKKAKQMPVQPSFRMASDVYQTFHDETKAAEELGKNSRAKNAYDKGRVKKIIMLVKHWLENYAPNEYKYELVNHQNRKLTKKQRAALIEFSNLIKSNKTQAQIKKSCAKVFDKYDVKPREFFKITYETMFGKERGPRLGQYIIAHDAKKISGLIKQNVE